MDSAQFNFFEANDTDFPRIVIYYKKEDYGLQHLDWIYWKYYKNPQGKGRFFYIEDATKEIVGTLGYMPQILTGKNFESTNTVQAVDLYISPHVRGKKLYPKFQHYATKFFDCPLIAFPNSRSEKITID